MNSSLEPHQICNVDTATVTGRRQTEPKKGTYCDIQAIELV